MAVDHSGQGQALEGPDKWREGHVGYDQVRGAVAPGGLRFASHHVLAPSSTTSAKLRAQVVPQEPKPPTQATPPVECEASYAHHRPVRLRWARLLKRVFEIDLEHCPNCGDSLKISAAILEQSEIEKILTHLGLQARAPPRAPARGSKMQAA